MAKKEKLGVSRLVERVENLVGDALKRIDNLQNQVHDLREQVMDRVGLSEKSSRESTSESTKGTGSPGSSTPGTSTAGKSATSRSSGSGQSKKQKSDLTRIKGLGPATASKMEAKGITSLSQLANPSAEDQKKLDEFKKLKRFAHWQQEAKKLV